MHDPVALVGEWLKRVTLGYYNYYAVPGNIDRPNIFAQRLRRLWRLILSRRSQRGRAVWDRLDPDLSALDSSIPRSPCLCF
jgi:RNA-directed DNA polymerase